MGKVLVTFQGRTVQFLGGYPEQFRVFFGKVAKFEEHIILHRMFEKANQKQKHMKKYPLYADV